MPPVDEYGATSEQNIALRYAAGPEVTLEPPSVTMARIRSPPVKLVPPPCLGLGDARGRRGSGESPVCHSAAAAREHATSRRIVEGTWHAHARNLSWHRNCPFTRGWLAVHDAIVTRAEVASGLPPPIGEVCSILGILFCSQPREFCTAGHSRLRWERRTRQRTRRQWSALKNDAAQSDARNTNRGPASTNTTLHLEQNNFGLVAVGPFRSFEAGL